MRFNTPLRYPGGKGKLSGFIERLLNFNELSDIHYAEPYAGGAGLAFKLLFNGYAKQLYLNDINLSVYAFWYSVLNDSEKLCSLISSTTVDMDQWHKQKKIIASPEEHDLLTLGFAIFFLNRTNRSGILKGGVIGVKEQSGLWKLDARYNKKDLIARINAIANVSDKIDIYNMDASDFIDKIVKNIPSNSLTYLYPPYYVKGKGLYENHYKHDDHYRIANKVTAEIKTPWLVSYDNNIEINKMYDGCPKLTYGINYSAQQRYMGSEVMFFSKDLRIPKTNCSSKLLK
ncbi:DNA adenine methylase [Yersinia bercovieri]|uniref:DNA adenine methylase n=1 Tax=Yersinia bercovieri TaxID=634 RepID=UPI0011A06FC6|nr:DNA adenine methylase [Yersinia bercovieri]